MTTQEKLIANKRIVWDIVHLAEQNGKPIASWELYEIFHTLMNIDCINHATPKARNLLLKQLCRS